MASPDNAAASQLTNLRVLIAEDDPEVAESLDLWLRVFHCTVDIAADGPQALERAINGGYDVILLDLSLPRMDGLAVCTMVRQQLVFTPIMMLTARASEGDKVIGLGAGADDYLTKPFSSLELEARLNALMRRSHHYGQPQPTALRCAGVVIDLQRRAVTVADRAVNLTAREFDLLVALARHPGRVFTRGQLLDGVWGYSHDGYGHTVDSHINRLRAKIESDPANPRCVLTVRGVGYRFSEH